MKPTFDLLFFDMFNSFSNCWVSSVLVVSSSLKLFMSYIALSKAPHPNCSPTTAVSELSQEKS